MKSDEEIIMQHARNLYVASTRDYANYLKDRAENQLSARLSTDEYDVAMQEVQKTLSIKGTKYSALVNSNFIHSHKYLVQLASLGVHFRKSQVTTVGWMTDMMDLHGEVRS